MTEQEAQQLAAGVGGQDDPSEYIRRALEGKSDFGEYAHTFVSRAPDGTVNGAMTLVDHPEDEDNPVGYSTIDYIGAKGVGSQLVDQALQHAAENNLSLYAEPTPSSFTYWRDKMGMTEDPDGFGSPFYGWSADEVKQRLARPQITRSYDHYGERRVDVKPFRTKDQFGKEHEVNGYVTNGPSPFWDRATGHVVKKDGTTGPVRQGISVPIPDHVQAELNKGVHSGDPMRGAPAPAQDFVQTPELPAGFKDPGRDKAEKARIYESQIANLPSVVSPRDGRPGYREVTGDYPINFGVAAEDARENALDYAIDQGFARRVVDPRGGYRYEPVPPLDELSLERWLDVESAAGLEGILDGAGYDRDGQLYDFNRRG